MNRLLVLACLWIPATVWAQVAPTSQITISTNPPVGRFAVDGQPYLGSATFLWPKGSQHILQFYVDNGSGSIQTSTDQTTQYTFGGWQDNLGLLASNGPIQTITADPTITSIKGTMTVAYRVQLALGSATTAAAAPVCGSPGNIPSNVFLPGIVYIGGTCYWSSATFWVPAGTLVANAFAFPGFAFLGWVDSSQSASAYLTTITIKGPTTIQPVFTPAKRVTFLTNPPGLDVLVDHTLTQTRSSATSDCIGQRLPVAAPATVTPLCIGDFDFAPNSTHVIGGVSPQVDLSSKTWVFDSWSTGAGQNSNYQVDGNTNVSAVLTANFVPGATASFVTVPSGLKLTVDGRSNWPAYNFVWAVGTTHTVTAAPQNTDSKGRKYNFRSWSNNGGATQTVTVDTSAASNGLRMIATYDELSRVMVQTSPAGLTVQVDGTPCQTPCAVDRPRGATVAVSATASIPTGSGARLDLAGWSDGASGDHVYTIASDYSTLTASYSPSYKLSMGSSPAAGAQFAMSPASADNYFPANTTVTVTAQPLGGFQFLRWNGDLAGTYPTGYLTVNRPETVVAMLSRVPYIAPTGVQNAAGATPGSGVAAGSLISITGESLSPDSVVGPASPLSQSLDGVTVTVGDRILPLVSVSPQTVVAQLYSDWPNGDYTLTVHAQGQPDVSGNFTIVNNAPGLFTTTLDSGTFAVATHADGSAVAAASPAAPGEQVTLYGTGFGPYTKLMLDGFFPPNPTPSLKDPVQVTVGNTTVTADSAVAASGHVGYTAVKFTITSDMPSGTNANVTATIDGQTSNTVVLPLK